MDREPGLSFYGYAPRRLLCAPVQSENLRDNTRGNTANGCTPPETGHMFSNPQTPFDEGDKRWDME